MCIRDRLQAERIPSAPDLAGTDQAAAHRDYKDSPRPVSYTHLVRVVGNKVLDAQDEAFIRSRIPPEDLLGIIHYNRQVIDADRQGRSPFDVSPDTVREIEAIKAKMDQQEEEQS